MKRHPDKDIRQAINYALANGWKFKESNGHAFGRLYCMLGHSEHQLSVWSTPRNSSNHAKQIVAFIDKCQD